MCLIVFTPNIARARIQKSVLETGFNKNDDGAGFAYIVNGRVIVSKAYFEFDKFYKAFRSKTNGLTCPVLIHFRWGTKGSKHARNVQPLVVYANQLVMAHNGVFEGLSQHKEDVSDSVNLARLIRRMEWVFPFSAAHNELLEGMCFGKNKLVFLSDSGAYKIINEKAGGWMRGAWYSDKKVVEDKKPVRMTYGYYSNNNNNTKKCAKVTQSKLLPPGTLWSSMTAEQRDAVMAWEKRLMVDPTAPAPWIGHTYPRDPVAEHMREFWD